MSRTNGKKGFSLSETMTVIVVLGCIVALAIGMFNFSSMKNNTIAAKQAKLENALKSATMSIMGNENLLSVTKACDAVAMRDLYAANLNNAEIIDDIIVKRSVVVFDLFCDRCCLLFSGGSCLRSIFILDQSFFSLFGEFFFRFFDHFFFDFFSGFSLFRFFRSLFRLCRWGHPLLRSRLQPALRSLLQPVP